MFVCFDDGDSSKTNTIDFRDLQSVGPLIINTAITPEKYAARFQLISYSSSFFRFQIKGAPKQIYVRAGR